MHHLANLPTPTAEDIRWARDEAGLTQPEAGRLIGLTCTDHRDGPTCKSWSDYERGYRPIPALKWAAFLLAIDNHPHFDPLTLTVR